METLARQHENAPRSAGTTRASFDFPAAHDLGGAIMGMRHEQVVKTETVDQLLKHPRHPYTKLLLESRASPDPDLRCTASADELVKLEVEAGVTAR